MSTRLFNKRARKAAKIAAICSIVAGIFAWIVAGSFVMFLIVTAAGLAIVVPSAAFQFNKSVPDRDVLTEKNEDRQ